MTKNVFRFRISAISAMLCIPLSLTLFSCEQAGIPVQPNADAVSDTGSKLFVAGQSLLQTSHPGYEITDILYNPDHSLKSYKTDGGAFTTSVTYAPNKVVYTTLFAGKKSSDIVYDLVNQVAVKKYETFYTSSGNVTDQIQTDYIYQAGRVIKEYFRENNLPDGHLVYYYDEHNVTFQERYDADGNLVNKMSYEYYLKFPDKSTDFSQFNFKMDARLFPQKSLNLVATKYLKKPGKNPAATHYTYILNGSGYPTSGTASGLESYNWTSTWQQ